MENRSFKAIRPIKNFIKKLGGFLFYMAETKYFNQPDGPKIEKNGIEKKNDSKTKL